MTGSEGPLLTEKSSTSTGKTLMSGRMLQKAEEVTSLSPSNLRKWTLTTLNLGCLVLTMIILLGGFVFLYKSDSQSACNVEKSLIDKLRQSDARIEFEEIDLSSDDLYNAQKSKPKITKNYELGSLSRSRRSILFRPEEVHKMILERSKLEKRDFCPTPFPFPHGAAVAMLIYYPGWCKWISHVTYNDKIYMLKGSFTNVLSLYEVVNGYMLRFIRKTELPDPFHENEYTINNKYDLIYKLANVSSIGTTNLKGFISGKNLKLKRDKEVKLFAKAAELDEKKGPIFPGSSNTWIIRRDDDDNVYVIRKKDNNGQSLLVSHIDENSKVGKTKEISDFKTKNVKSGLMVCGSMYLLNDRGHPELVASDLLKSKAPQFKPVGRALYTIDIPKYYTVDFDPFIGAVIYQQEYHYTIYYLKAKPPVSKPAEMFDGYSST